MSKVKANLIKVNMTAGKYELAVLIALRANIENGMVYLDNAFEALEKHGMTRHQFAGYLSSLTKQGLYKAHDQYFGELI